MIQIKDLNVSFAGMTALSDLSLDIAPKQVLACIGPSGSGKSVFLQALNRSCGEQAHMEGSIILDGKDIYSEMNPLELRRKVGLILTRPATFPGSILENVAFGLKMRGGLSRSEIIESVEQALRRAELWEEVSDRLNKPAARLSEGQQQRMCIARALALQPRVLLLDEPTRSLDPIATGRIEQLCERLKQEITIIISSHTVQQASRVSDRTLFFLHGRLIEEGLTQKLFMQPMQQATADYISGRFQ
ncbi:MAG: phosphate ABC transporter ATP-binding protein [Spirochaetaceae bacterium]|nr:MAG: phosphate ABC transporter ATP-binding protein [Spirochaetaceae bacterium]